MFVCAFFFSAQSSIRLKPNWYFQRACFVPLLFVWALLLHHSYLVFFLQDSQVPQGFWDNFTQACHPAPLVSLLAAVFTYSYFSSAVLPASHSCCFSNIYECIHKASSDTVECSMNALRRQTETKFYRYRPRCLFHKRIWMNMEPCQNYCYFCCFSNNMLHVFLKQDAN